MSDVTGGRREVRKAQTRADIRAAAQRLFAERGFDGVTSADVAAAAGVAVQTVFNHFRSKEDLFFDGRTPWVDGLATAVRSRPPGSDPLTALREYVTADLVTLIDQEARPENRSYLEGLATSPALQARERSLVELAAQRLATVLVEAIPAGSYAAASRDADPLTAQVLGRLCANLFLVAGRVIVLEHRRLLLDPAADPVRARAVGELITATLTMLEDGLRGLVRERLGGPRPVEPGPPDPAA